MDIIKSEMHLEITISIIIFLRVNAKEKKWGALGDLFKKKSMCNVFLIGNRQRLATWNIYQATDKWHWVTS